MQSANTIWCSLEFEDKILIDWHYRFNVEELSMYIYDGVDFELIYNWSFDINSENTVTFIDRVQRKSLCVRVKEYDGLIPYSMISKNLG